MTDERRKHPGYEPTNPPPKRVLGVDVPMQHTPNSRPPDLSSVAGLASEARRWTPLGIVGAVCVLISLVLALLGGRAGVQELIGASEATQREIKASEARILKALEDHADTERDARAELQAADLVHERREERLAEAFSKINGGAPERTWPTPREGAWTSPPARQPVALTGWKTDQNWPEKD